MYVHISVGNEPCQELSSGDRLLRYILACPAPLAVEQPAVRAPSPSFGCVQDRQAIRGSGAITEPAVGLSPLRSSSGTSSAAGCGGRSRERGSPDPGSQTFYLQISVFYSGGTRIRTGDTMIFSHIQKPLGMEICRIGKRISVLQTPRLPERLCRQGRGI
jgi:hypothetical protein